MRILDNAAVDSSRSSESRFIGPAAPKPVDTLPENRICPWG